MRNAVFGDDGVDVGARGGEHPSVEAFIVAWPPDVARNAIIERLPVSAAARVKSTCPPTAPIYTPRLTSAPTCPVRSTSTAKFTDTSECSCESTCGLWV